MGGRYWSLLAYLGSGIEARLPELEMDLSLEADCGDEFEVEDSVGNGGDSY